MMLAAGVQEGEVGGAGGECGRGRLEPSARTEAVRAHRTKGGKVDSGKLSLAQGR